MTNVVVVGGGLAGLGVARMLSRRLKTALITVIDVKSIHVNPYTAGFLAKDTRYAEIPFQAIAQRFGFKVIRGEVTSIDIAQSEVITPALRVPFTYLVLCAGSEPNPSTVSGAKENALAGWAMEDMARIRHEIDFRCTNRATKTEVSCGVIGGGRVGVSMASAVAEYVHEKYPTVPFQISVYEAASRLLAHYPHDAARLAERYMEKKGIRIRCNESVVRVGAHHITTEHEEAYPADISIWTAASSARRVSVLPPVPTNATHHILASSSLRVRPYTNIFVLGDVAAIPLIHRKPSVVEIEQEAEYIATVLPLLANNQRIPAFAPKSLPEIIPLGEETALYIHRGLARIGPLYAAKHKAMQKKYYHQLV